MPQVRDPKTGRYTSGGGSSVGGAAGTNPRIQKARAMSGGASAGGSSPAQQKKQALERNLKAKKQQDIETKMRKISADMKKLEKYSGTSGNEYKTLAKTRAELAKELFSL